jgi:hypothetical protein
VYYRDMPIYAIDLYSGNYYPGFTLPLQAMYDHGFRHACIKASMGGGNDYRFIGGKQFDTVEWYANYFRAAGWDVSLYHWVDATQALDPQVQRFAAQLKRLGVEIGILDWEQWWADWTKYYQMSRGEIVGTDVPRIAPVKNVAAAQFFLAHKDLALLRQLEVYTYAYFMTHAYERSNLPVPKTWPFSARKPWIAAYPTLKPESVVMETWEEWEKWTPEGSPIAWAGNRPAGLQPTEWSWWQMQSRIYLPGAKDHYDYSIFNGDENAYNAWAGKVVIPPDPWEKANKDAILKSLALDHKLYP